MQILILSGLPGSGKSTFLKKLPLSRIFSTDHYFEDKYGNYNFDSNKLSEAHGWCFRKYLESIQDGIKYNANCIYIVDNTNLSIEEIAPYMAVANAYKIPAYLINIKCNVLKSFIRQKHNVPFLTYLYMYIRLLKRNIPDYWIVMTDSEYLNKYN